MLQSELESANLDNDDPSDNLLVQCQHVDGGMNAIQRGAALDWLKADTTADGEVCRVLTNARCLSEGVDVPTLDAVLFLNPRRSQVDVIQAVGRVMRKAEGKEYGYIILPVAVPAGVSPEAALNDNKRFEVVWQVLQAIRAHDERFDATVNAIEYNHNRPENIVVDVISLSKPPVKSALDGEGGERPDNTVVIDPPIQLVFPVEDWKDAVYSKLVKKVGNRLYWDDWSKDIADVAARHMTLIEHLLEDPQNQDAFAAFLKSLQQTLNPAVTGADAVEMLAQHLITKPLFDAMFPDQAFTAKNPVSMAMEGILSRLATNTQFELEREPLQKFYDVMTSKITEIDNLAGKQDIMRTLYDNFFTKAFARMQDRLGIVFTPVEVVDYILHSADDALQRHLGCSLSDRGVAVVEPFLGTGTFVTRLLQSGLIRKEDLEHKYRNEIFANEIVLLSYYIASINIEQVYSELRNEHGFTEEYQEFTGISLTDTFQISEGSGEEFSEFDELQINRERLERQRVAPIQVVVMNPPYSAGQKSANDNNQNLKYPALDKDIAETYAELSTATNKNSLYDSYYRALRWASNRIGKEGVIAFVANSSFLDSSAAQGVRRAWQREFSDVYVYNLRGGIRRKIGDVAKREGGNVFSIMAGVAIAVLVKKRGYEGEARIHYAEVADYLTAHDKLAQLKREGSLRGSEFIEIQPNAHGDWINQRDEKYLTYQSVGDPKTKGKDTTPGIFRQFSRGLETSRDAWCYNFSAAAGSANIQRMISNYNEQIAVGIQDMTSTQVAWSRKLKRDFSNGKRHIFKDRNIRHGIYRPFCVQQAYFDDCLNEYTNQLPRLFPTPEHPNLTIGVTGSPEHNGSVLMCGTLPDLNVLTATNFFALYTWEPETTVEKIFDGFDFAALAEPATADTSPDSFSGSFDFKQPISRQVPAKIAGYQRVDNITDATLVAYRAHYHDEVSPSGEQITKEDIFFYVYALLHHPEYREKYAADLKKMLPRIPKVKEFWSYALIGRELAELHVNYETVEAHPAVSLQWAKAAPTDPHQKYRVTKLAWGKGETAKTQDRTTLVYNEYLTFTGIPVSEGEYRIAGRSPLEWVIDRYRVTTHKESGIVNDPNTFCAEIGNPAYIAELIPKLVTVSLRTQELLGALPELQITE